MTREIGEVAVGRKFRADKIGYGIVVGRGYYLTHVVWLDSDGVPALLDTVPDCLMVKPRGVSRHVPVPVPSEKRYSSLFEVMR